MNIDKELTLKELLAIDEIIADLMKEDLENELYKSIREKLNIQIMEWIPF